MSDKPESTAVDLLQHVDAQLRNVHTQSLDISFNELADMVSEKELNISPDYQRLFQWSEGARSRFIESLLLEMPVPPIYVVEEDDGTKLLIDGLQRLSSYLHFRGKLNASHLTPAVEPGNFLVLQDCDIIPELNGITYNELGTSLQIKLKRSFVRVEVVRKGSNPKFKYHMFKRLNTGGEVLTNQQLRNCTIRLLDPKFNDFINALADTESYRSCISTISDQDVLGAYDRELVLRFFALKNWRPKFKHDVADFLTEYMEAVSDPDKPLEFDYIGEKDIFQRTFEVLNAALGEQAFSRANRARTGLITGFGIYHFEAFTIGIQGFLGKIDLTTADGVGKIKQTLMSIKLNAEFMGITTGGGKNSTGLLRQRIGFVEEKMAEAYP